MKRKQAWSCTGHQISDDSFTFWGGRTFTTWGPTPGDGNHHEFLLRNVCDYVKNSLSWVGLLKHWLVVMVVKVFERMFSGDPFEVLRTVLNLPWRCRSLAPGPSEDPGNRVKGEKWRSLLTLGNSTSIRLAKLCPEKLKLRRFEAFSSIMDLNFTPWA